MATDDDALDDPAYAPLDPNELAALAADGALDAPPPVLCRRGGPRSA
jgi:hypothetical protein